MNKSKTYLLSDLDENPYLQFSTGINVNKLPRIIQETVLVDEISFEYMCSVIMGRKLIIPYFSFSTPINKRLNKFKYIKNQNMKIAIIDDDKLTLDIFHFLREIEYSNIYFLACFSGDFRVSIPQDKKNGITFGFDELYELVFIKFEQREIITFKF